MHFILRVRMHLTFINESRSDEYDKSLKQINSSYEEYKKWFKTYMETWIAEARQQSAEATVSWLNEFKIL